MKVIASREEKLEDSRYVIEMDGVEMNWLLEAVDRSRRDSAGTLLYDYEERVLENIFNVLDRSRCGDSNFISEADVSEPEREAIRNSKPKFPFTR